MQTLESTPTNTQTPLFIAMAIRSWSQQNDLITKFLETTTDEQLKKEITPGRNNGVYLLGHLVAASDGLFPLFELGERLFPLLAEPFQKLPYKLEQTYPSIAELKANWSEVSTKLAQRFETMKSQDWFLRHTAVSAEDFAKEPHRNKLNVLLSRTTHLSYHLGQMVLLKPRKE